MLGVSPDGEASHEKFKEKYDLPFTLLADTDHEVAEEYGVWGEKSYAGKTYMGVDRSTFVIDADGQRRARSSTTSSRTSTPTRCWRRSHLAADAAARLTVLADVAELVDAHGSGPCARKGVEVQVLSSA